MASMTVKKKGKLLLPLLICGLFLGFARDYLLRDLWFDEALTILHFALLDSPLEIYRNYLIPNNQILYTILLHYWMPLQPAAIGADVWNRLLSVLFGLATLVLLHRMFRVRLGGGAILLPALAACAVSVPFLIYGTAVRGYMLSALCVVGATHFALEFSRRPAAGNTAGYFLCCLAAVAAIPSNLIVLAGVVLYALPLYGNQFYRKGPFWLLAAIPPLALLLFYWPIAPDFLRAAALGEGWESGVKVVAVVGVAFLYSFAMLLVPALAALMAFDRSRFRWIWSARALILLLPIPAALLLPTAPFPRVFFPFWPLWVLLLSAGIRDLTALNCRLQRRWNFLTWIGGLTLIVILWGLLANQPGLRLTFSRGNGGAGADDFYYGYYLRPDHTPRTTMAELARVLDGRPVDIYASFTADPWPLLFYGRLYDMPINRFLFDGPQGLIPTLPSGGVVILRSDEAPLEIEERFHCRMRPMFQNNNHAVYVTEH